MRVAYLMRVDALDKPGGDVEHMRSYIRGCEQIAQRRGFTFQGKILTDLHPDLSAFDVIHLTNLDRPIDLYSHFLAARQATKPIVLTPLHHSYREIERYERQGRRGLVGFVSGRFGFSGLEAARIFIKLWRYPQLWLALLTALRKGIRNTQSEVLHGCDRVLVITDKEAADIAFEITEISLGRVLKLRNGFQNTKIETPVRDIDIAVIARVESRKNQIAVLDAIESLGLKATFVGPPNPNHKHYCKSFRRKIARSASSYIPGVPSAEVTSILARAKVHIAASWFEVASLVDLDAYAQGCRVVASRCGGTHEVIGEDAYYVDPGSPADITAKIAAAVESANAGTQNSMQDFLQKAPTWDETCTRLLDLYCELSGHTSSPSS